MRSLSYNSKKFCLLQNIGIAQHVIIPQQYVAAGTLMGFNVAIRVVDSKALSEHKGNDFLCEALTILKYVGLPTHASTTVYSCI